MRPVFPDHSDKWLELSAINSFRHSSWFAAEFLKDLSPFVSHDKTDAIVTNPCLLSDAIKTGSPIVCFISHSYNFEHILSQLHRFGQAEYCFIYQPVRALPLLDSVIRWKRERSAPNIKLFPSDDALGLTRYILSRSKMPDSLPLVIGVVGDVIGSGGAPTVDFLNGNRPMVVGVEKIGRKIKAQFFYISTHSIRRGCCKYSIIRIPQDSKDEYHFTRRFYHLLERDIMAYPADWLLWN